MKKKLLITLLLFAMLHTVQAQTRLIDSLNKLMHTADNDTLRLALAGRLSWEWMNIKSDSSLHYADMYYSLADRGKFDINKADALYLKAFNHVWLVNYARALEELYTALDLVTDQRNSRNNLSSKYLTLLQVPANLQSFEKYRSHTEACIHTIFSLLYWILGRNEGIGHLEKIREISRMVGDTEMQAQYYFYVGNRMVGSNPDSALYYYNLARPGFMKGRSIKIMGSLLEFTGGAYQARGDLTSELRYLKLGLNYHLLTDNIRNSGFLYWRLASFYLTAHKTDSAIYFSQKALEVANNGPYPDLEVFALENMAGSFKQLKQKDSTLKYLELLVLAKEKVRNVEDFRQIENVENNQKLRARELQEANEKYRNRLKLYGLAATLIMLVGFLLMLLRILRIRAKANRILSLQKEQIEFQRNKAENALVELKNTQSQLIQSEKMASLGELTAGIAHEIQNPLNFVNNFSEINTELIVELLDERKKKIRDLRNEDEIISTIKGNEEKINQHGKRADAIVKGMLLHSRSSAGIKESANINALADEYLRLAYHGLRAKDKSFNATMKTDFDETIGNINIIPQDIGRVILNLITNAFYAVTEKKIQQPDSFEPIVSISTKKENGKVEVIVKDNGNGIPQKVLDKIFQPFFTTKPSGQGTGLGLSMSYEIITKGHNGELKVHTKEGEGSAFTIVLPV